MSAADAVRFAKDLTTNHDLAAQVKTKASGLSSLVDIGKANGYAFTADEIKAVIRGAAKRELSDNQLDTVAGGSGDVVVTQGSSAVVIGVSSVVVQDTAAQVTQLIGVNQVAQAVVQSAVMTVVA